MADNSGNKKKTLLVSLLAFLFIGGGVFLFFIIEGSDDLTGAGRANNFVYGFSVRDAVLPLFKRLGISTYEDEIVRPRKRLEAGSIDLSPETSAPADVSDWMAGNGAGAPSASSSSGARPAAIPKLSGSGGSPAGGSGGDTKSAGGVSRFGDGAASGNTAVSARAQAGAGGPAGKGTLGSLKNARAMLGEGLRSDSAMTARSKWEQSFGVGGGGKSGDLAYAKIGLVNLDKIKSGEISSLKLDKKGSLKIAEVDPPVKDAEGTEKALAGDKKTKEDMEIKLKTDIAKNLVENTGNALTKSQDGDSTSDNSSPGPDDSGACDLNAGPPTALCSAALDPSNLSERDTGVEYKQVGADGDDKMYKVTYKGVGPGITDQYSRQTVNYSDTVLMRMDSSGNVKIIGEYDTIETPRS